MVFISLKFVTTIIFLNLSFSNLIPRKNYLLSEAIPAFILKCEPIKRATINFIGSEQVQTKDEIEGALLGLKGLNLLFQVESFDQALKDQSAKRFFSIIFVGDFKSFIKFSDEIKHENFQFNGHFLIIFKEPAIEKIEIIFKTFWDKFIFNVNILVKAQSSSKALLFTFFPFNGESCGVTTPTIINDFDDESSRWRNGVFFPMKLRNLQNCSVKVGYDKSHASTSAKRLSNGTVNYSGVVVDILRGLATTLNFSIAMTEFSQGVGIFFDNKSATGLMNRAYIGDVNLIFGTLSLQKSRMEYLSDSRPIFSDNIILVIPKAILLGSFEKLLLPFEFFTWIAVLLLIFVACIVLTCLKFFPVRIRDFVIGKAIRNNYLNLWNVLLGGSQVKVPGRNFARFLLMSFVLFCLVMRSSYTGSLFNIMKKDINSREIENFDDLNRLGFTFYIYESLADRLKDETFIKR